MSRRFEFLLPDLGDFEHVEVIEVLVSPGERVEAEQALVVLESDKATMEIPSPKAGLLTELCVKVGDAVTAGARIAWLELDDAGDVRETGDAGKAGTQRSAAPAATTTATVKAADSAPADMPTAEAAAPAAGAEGAEAAPPLVGTPNALAEARVAPAPNEEAADPPKPVQAHAGPSVRRLAHELGVDLSLVPGSGRKGRITKSDVQQYVKASLSGRTAGGVPIAGVSVAAPLNIDFSKFGETELQPLSRIRKLSAANLHRSWVSVPHVTQFDEADITELERFRKAQRESADARGVKLTFLPFLVKAVSAALREFPHFNASLDPSGENLVVKRYLNIGVAVDTENGLVVPVIRNAGDKGVLELAAELQELSLRARTRKLRPGDLQGGSFSISSLGGIGGTLFTPIVNHPEVAILGVSRMRWQPVMRGSAKEGGGPGKFIPRLMLPLSLSYDHRVIDGADAVRFTTRLSALLSELRLMLL